VIKKIRPFDTPGTYFHNYALDVIMPKLSHTGWKVLCVAIRQTWGWVDKTTPSGRRERDVISYSQFKEKTGIKSDATISKALKECLDAKYLLRFKVGEHPGTRKPIYAYALNTDYEVATSENEVEATSEIEVEPDPTSKNEEAATSKNEVEATSEIEETKERKKKQKKDTGGVSSAEALSSFAQTMGEIPDPAIIDLAAGRNEPEAVNAWIEAGKRMTNLSKAVRFRTVMRRLLDQVAPPAPGTKRASLARYFETQGPLLERQADQDREPADPALARAQEVWQTALRELALQMTRGTFNQWLKPTQAVSREDGVFVVGVASAYAQEWLDSRLRSAVERTLAGIVGGEVAVQFVVVGGEDAA